MGFLTRKQFKKPVFFGDLLGFLNEKGDFWRAIPANLLGYCRRFWGKGELGNKEQGTADREKVFVMG
jgi:hypothetical protein